MQVLTTASLARLSPQVRKAAQETAAGALHALATAPANRVSIADAGGIPLLVSLFDVADGSDESKEQAAGALLMLALHNVPNQIAISSELIEMLRGYPSTCNAKAAEHVTQLLGSLAQDDENRGVIAKAGGVPELARQLAMGSELAMASAASGLALLALGSDKTRATVTQELVKLLASEDEAVRQRASSALRHVAAGEKMNKAQRQGSKTNSGGGSGCAPLVRLLQDGLKDGNVEAQEYAL